MERKIGQFDGAERGALIIVIGALHGNETAGVVALRQLFDMLEAERQRKPNFVFRGRIVGLIGNVQAYERKIRFVKTDLNRHFTLQNIQRVGSETPQYSNASSLFFEDLELAELVQVIENQIFNYQPNRLVLLDLHTTSAAGGIFSIVSDDDASLDLAISLHIPVVRGMIGNVGGSTLHFFTEKNMHVPTIAVAFEAGKHDDPNAPRLAIAWLVNALRSVGAVSPFDVEHRHDEILRGHARRLPKVVDLIHVHRIALDDHFQMLPDFENFQAVRQGELLARDRHGYIAAPEDCLILMPLYQAKGKEGFFLVKEKT